MKLKYYMRGLGIGILVTAIIMSVAYAGRDEMTDEEIKARAKALGMVESMVLSEIGSDKEPEITSEPEPTKTPKVTETPATAEPPLETETPVETDTSEGTENFKETETPEETDAPAGTEEPSETDDSASAKGSFQINGDVVTVTIEGGMSSVAVSKLLEEAGLISSAGSYDRYLCDRKYDKRIRTGVYQIPMGATEEEITQMIVGF